MKCRNLNTVQIKMLPIHKKLKPKWAKCAIQQTISLFIFIFGILIGQPFNGMTLFSPTGGGGPGGGSFNTYLVNNDIDVISISIYSEHHEYQDRK